MPSSEFDGDSGYTGEMEPDESGATAANERIYTIMGATSAVGILVAFSFVGVSVFESPVYGIIAGAMSGGGSYLFLPWFLKLSAVQENTDRSTAEAIQQLPGNPALKLFGLGLDLGGVVMFATGFVLDEPNLLYGTASGVAVALVVYLVASIVVDRLGVR